MKEGKFNSVSQLPASAQPVAYFCAEFAVSDILPIYSGGLGVLAGDVLREASQTGTPFIGVGLFYKKGYFHQTLTATGQEESYRDINPTEAGLTLMRDEAGETSLVEIMIEDRIVYVQIWKYALGSVTLYLLDTDHWKNRPEDRTITEKLYNGDHANRLQQEIILGIGGYRALQLAGVTPRLYHLNEGHSALLSLELIREALLRSVTLEKAIHQARERLVFTNHTLVPAGNDTFTHDLIAKFLSNYAFESGIPLHKLFSLGAVDNQPGVFSMTLLALRMAKLSNAVSLLHAKKAQELWPGFKLKGITNGVNLPFWVAPELQALWNKYLPSWQKEPSKPAVWKPVYKIDPAELWLHHNQLKGQMLDEVYARTGIQLDPNALTIVWARRFATYKRPDLLFADLDRLRTILFDQKRPVQVIIAGKSHPADTEGKEIVEKIDELANYDLQHRVVFVNDYSITLAKFLVAGADVWLNTPLFGLEASGTSGMKASANGVIQFTVPDGWAHELDWYGMGYALPIEKAETEIYHLLERYIVPTYYKRNSRDLPLSWIGMMKRTIAMVSPRYSATRMFQDYQSTLYR